MFATDLQQREQSVHIEVPTDEGEIKTVTVESTGDQGDGIAKVERGCIVIIPGSVPGDKLAVEIQCVKENFSMAEIVNDSELTYE